MMQTLEQAGLTEADGEWADDEGTDAVVSWIDLGLLPTEFALSMAEELEAFATEMLLRGMARKAKKLLAD